MKLDSADGCKTLHVANNILETTEQYTLKEQILW